MGMLGPRSIWISVLFLFLSELFRLMGTCLVLGGFWRVLLSLSVDIVLLLEKKILLWVIADMLSQKGCDQIEHENEMWKFVSFFQEKCLKIKLWWWELLVIIIWGNCNMVFQKTIWNWIYTWKKWRTAAVSSFFELTLSKTCQIITYI